MSASQTVPSPRGLVNRLADGAFLAADGSDLPAGHVGHDAGGDETSGGDAHCSEGLGGEGQGDEEVEAPAPRDCGAA